METIAPLFLTLLVSDTKRMINVWQATRGFPSLILNSTDFKSQRNRPRGRVGGHVIHLFRYAKGLSINYMRIFSCYLDSISPFLHEIHNGNVSAT